MGSKAENVAWTKLRVASSDGRRSQILASQVETDEWCYRSEAVARLRSWERYGWGKVRLGRRGWETRFLVSSPTTRLLRQQAAAAPPSPAKVKIAPVAPAPADQAVTDDPPAISAENADGHIDFVSHPFQLRADLAIKLNLPGDITDREAARLARFVESLPL